MKKLLKPPYWLTVWLLIISVHSCPFVVTSHAAIVVFQFQDNFGRAATPAVSLTPVSVPLNQSGTLVLSGLTTFRQTAWTNQTVSGLNIPQLVLPLSAGGYVVQVSSWPRAWSLTVPDSTNTFYAADLSSNTLILGPQTVINNYAAGLLTNALATNAPGVSIANGMIVISTNYDAFGAAAGVQGAIQAQFNALTNGFVDRSVTNTALNRLAQNDGSALAGLNASALASGTVPGAQMPAFTGDITTATGSTASTLKNTGTPGAYTKVTTDSAGRVTAGSTLSLADLPTGYNNGGNAAVATNAQTVTGLQSNAIALALTNTLAIYTDPINAVQEFKNTGQYQYLADFAAFEPQYGMTNKTWAGANITLQNCTNTAGGLYLGTNSYVDFPCYVTSSNTIALVVGFDGVFGPSMAQSGNIWELLETNSNSGEFTYIQNNPWVGTFLQSNNICWPSTQNLTNLIVDPWLSYGGAFWYATSPRWVFVFTTDGSGNETIYRDGMSSTYYLSGNQFIKSPLYGTNVMNRMRIGLPFNTSTQNRLGFAGTVESIWLFNKFCDTNLLRAIGWAADWTQFYTKRRFKIGDSLMSGNSNTNNLATMVDTADGFNDAQIHPFYLGGANFFGSWSANNNANTTNSIYYFNAPHGKITECQIDIAAGINDIYAGRSGATTFQLMSNLFVAPTISNPQWKINIYSLNQTWTNGSQYAQGGSAAQERINYNAYLFQNRNLFAHIYNRDYRVTQSMLNTNRIPRLSTAGLHFDDATNGDAAYRMLAGDVVSPERNPWLLTNLPPELIQFPASGIGFTNFFNDTVQIAIDNSGATGVTNLTKNGTIFLASPSSSVIFILGPNDYFSETYAGGSPKGYYQWTH